MRKILYGFLILLIAVILGVISWLNHDPFSFDVPLTNLQAYHSDSLAPAHAYEGLRKGSQKILTSGKKFVDIHGRAVFLKGVNLGGSSKVPFTPNIASHIENKFFKGEDISFVGRPFPLTEADRHFERLHKWGFNFVRFVVTWEAIEHDGPGLYDEEYLDYLYEIIKKASEYNIQILIDPHQDVWSRYSGGDGAPLWTFKLAGLEPRNFKESAAAIVHNTFGDPFPHLIWFTNYYKLAAGTMFTLFWGGNDFAPELLVKDSIQIQDFLQQHYINAFVQLAEKVKDLPNVIGFEVMNEPSSGYIGIKDINRKISSTYFGNAPTPAQAIFLGAGIPTEVETYSLGNFGINQGENLMLNLSGQSAWSNNGKGIWHRQKVWDIIEDSAIVLQPNYFNHVNGKEVNFTDDYFKPFVEKYARAIHAVDPDWMIFVEPSIFPFYSPMPDWTSTDLNFVYAGHAYDQFTLATKRFIPWIAIGGSGFVFGKKNVRALFNRRIANLRSITTKYLGDRPTILGEFGIPINLSGGKSFKSGNYDDQVDALNLNLEAAENGLPGYALWNYTADNTNQRGDQWNGEDLSIFSLSQQTNPLDINSGGRALEAVVRPYAARVSGNIIEHQFYSKEKVFLLRFTPDNTIQYPTEIFLPEFHFGKGYTAYTNSGKLNINNRRDRLYFRPVNDVVSEVIIVVIADK